MVNTPNPLQQNPVQRSAIGFMVCKENVKNLPANTIDQGAHCYVFYTSPVLLEGNQWTS